MLKRIRPSLFHWIAIVGLIALGGASFLYENATRLDAAYHQQANRKAAAYADHARVRVERECVRLAPPEKEECARQMIIAAREDQHNEYDLQAQRSTANWTRHMGIAAIFGTAFGIIGVLLVFATFGETRKANEINREAMEIENRPILVPGGMYFKKFGKDAWIFGFQWKNVGNLPAVIVGGRSVKFASDMETYETALSDALAEPAHFREEEITNQSIVATGECHRSRDFLFNLKDADCGKPTFAHGRVEYRNALASKAAPWHTEQLGVLSPTREHNAGQPGTIAIPELRFSMIRDGVNMT